MTTDANTLARFAELEAHGSPSVHEIRETSDLFWIDCGRCESTPEIRTTDYINTGPYSDASENGHLSNLLGSAAGTSRECNRSSPASPTVSLAQKAVAGDLDPAAELGDGGYADWVIVALHGLREYLDHPYRRLLDVLGEMHGIVAKLGLDVVELPDFSPVYARYQQLKMPIWRVLLRLSADLHDTGDVQAIDATGFDHVAASQHYAKRTNYTFRAVETTALVDCHTGAILDIYCSTKQPRDTQIGWQVLTRNLDTLSTVTADKGYDWDDLRRKLRDNGVRPVIKHRGFGSLDAAHNARLDDATYHQCSNVEATFFALRERFAETLRTPTWFGQFRELVLIAAVRNVELSVGNSAP